MRSFIRVLLIGISIIFTYQNCSLYQNEGRKFLDSVSDGANNPNPPAPTGRTISNLCVPYVVDQNLIDVYDAAFDIEAEKTESGSPPDNIFQCEITAGGGPGSLHYNDCSISNINRTDVENFIQSDPHDIGITTIDPVVCARSAVGGVPSDLSCDAIDSTADMDGSKYVMLFYAYTNPSNSAQVIVNVDMSNPGTAFRGVKCLFILNSTDWSTQNVKDFAKGRGRALSQAILQNILATD